MSVDVEAEEVTVRAFLSGNRRERWLEGLSSSKLRMKLTQRLCHQEDWLASRMTPTKPTGKRDQQLAGLHDRLCRLGAPRNCYVVAADNDLDGLTMPLREALDAVLDDGCALIICIPGILAVHLPETPEPPVILQKG